MSRDKQIEEMAKDFDTVMQRRCFHKSCNECEFDRYDTCKATMLATALINDYGYRKASEVAREIFEEADKIFMANCLSLETYGAWLELKKKHTEEGK